MPHPYNRCIHEASHATISMLHRGFALQKIMMGLHLCETSITFPSFSGERLKDSTTLRGVVQVLAAGARAEQVLEGRHDTAHTSREDVRLRREHVASYGGLHGSVAAYRNEGLALRQLDLVLDNPCIQKAIHALAARLTQYDVLPGSAAAILLKPFLTEYRATVEAARRRRTSAATPEMLRYGPLHTEQEAPYNWRSAGIRWGPGASSWPRLLLCARQPISDQGSLFQ